MRYTDVIFRGERIQKKLKHDMTVSAFTAWQILHYQGAYKGSYQKYLEDRGLYESKKKTKEQIEREARMVMLQHENLIKKAQGNG